MTTKSGSHALARPEVAFEADLRAAMAANRDAFADLLAAIGADPTRPQEVSRRFGINRNLAWKLSKILRTEELLSVVGHLPGTSGLRILLDTCRGHGASDDACATVQRAMDGFEQVVSTHAGDRARLEVLLSSLAGDQGAVDAQEASRRQAFLGNAAIWGVQARLQLGVLIHMPSAGHPDEVDAAALGGLLGFQRLRPTAAWPLVRHQAYHPHDGLLTASHRVEALDPDVPANGPPLVAAFSSVEPGALDPVSVTAGTLWELREGEVGLTGTVDCVFGHRSPRVGRQVAAQGELSAIAMGPLTTPVEAVQLDLLVHRDLAYAEARPRAELRSRLQTGADADAADAKVESQHSYLLPAPGRVVELGHGSSALASAWSPRHAELVDWALERMSQPLEAFRVWRLTMTFPPIPSAPTLRIDLPDA